MSPKSLIGEHIILEPLQELHRALLQQISNHPSSIWAFTQYKALGEKFNPWFDKAIAKIQADTQRAYVVKNKFDDQVIGTTRYYDLDFANRRLAIGYTWYHPDVWGTVANPESKYLLLQNAFENLDINRIEFFTDARNARSRAAIKKLGATEEGILRQDRILEDGHLRNTVVFSILAHEWPVVKSALLQRLESFNIKENR